MNKHSLVIIIAGSLGLWALAAFVLIGRPGEIRSLNKPAAGSGTPMSAIIQKRMEQRSKRFHLAVASKVQPKKKVCYCGSSPMCCLPLDADRPTLPSLRCIEWCDDWRMPVQSCFGAGVAVAYTIALPWSYRGRCTTGERLALIRQFGGTPECEAAVSAALESLKQSQKADGSWGDAARADITGLALLCFAGRCETPDSPFYGETVIQGILHLIATSNAHPKRRITTLPDGESAFRENAIATSALGEMYQLARMGSKSIPGMREAFEKGMEALLADLPREASAHPEAIGWACQALQTARISRLKIADLKDGIQQVMSMHFDATNQEFRHDAAIRSIHLLSMGLPIQQQQRLQTALESWAKERLKKGPSWKSPEALFECQAMFQAGGETWTAYEEGMRMKALALLTPSTSEPASVPSAGEFDERCIATLILESYYRLKRWEIRNDEASFFCK